MDKVRAYDDGSLLRYKEKRNYIHKSQDQKLDKVRSYDDGSLLRHKENRNY